MTGDDIDAMLPSRGPRHTGVVVATLLGSERRVSARGSVAEDSIFEIGSITKVFTSLLLARMAEYGRVGLDERPLPGHAITFAGLATHTAALPRLPAGMLVRALRERHDPYARFGSEDLDRAVAAIRPRRRAGPRGRSRPGARPPVRYSNFGGGLLGHLLAERAGRSYADLVADEICVPVGLHETFVTVPEPVRERFVDGHDRRGRRVPHWHFDALAGAGALRSTAADLLTFLEFQLAPPATPLGAAARAAQTERARRGRLGVGLGWMRRPLKTSEGTMIWHNGGTGGFRAFAGFVPERQAAVVVLSNCARSVDAIGVEILEALASG